MMPNNLKSLLISFEQNFYIISIRNKFLKAFVGVEEPQTETSSSTTVISTIKLRDLSSSSSCIIYTPTSWYE